MKSPKAFCFLLLLFLALTNHAQVHFNIGIEAGFQHSIIQPGVDLGNYALRSRTNATAAGLVQLLFPNGFGLETGLRTGLRDYWLKEKGIPRQQLEASNLIHQTILGIPFLLVKQSPGKFKKELTWRYSVGTTVNWYQLDGVGSDGRGSILLDPTVSLTAGGGLQYDCFLMELSGTYAFESAPPFPFAQSIGVLEPISPRFHVLQLGFKCFFLQFYKGHRAWF